MAAAPLPSPQHLRWYAFLAAQADAGVKVATIRRRAAAIHCRHASAQVESPTRSMLVTAALKGIHRELGVAPARKAPATTLRLVEKVRLCPATLQGRRDRELLLLGFAGVLRCSELVALQVAGNTPGQDEFGKAACGQCCRRGGMEDGQRRLHPLRRPSTSVCR